MLQQMQEGDMLELVRESENKHDECAIALHYNMEKIGYVPRESNEVLSRLIDARVVELQAEITHIERKAKAWENVHIAVFVLKEFERELDKGKTHLTELMTPKYYTLKHRDNTLSRIYYENETNERNYTGEDFYHDMVAHSKNDGVYDLLHGDLDANKLDEAVENGLFVSWANKLPKVENLDDLLQAMDDIVLNLDDYFAAGGLVMLNGKKLARLPDHIAGFVDIADKQGNHFIEVLFKDLP